MGHRLSRTGRSHRLKGDHNSALADYDEAIRLDRAVCACAYLGRAMIYAERREFDRAIVEYTEAIGLDPKLDVAYNNRGLIFADRQEYEKAIADFGKAIELDPTYAMSYNNCGLAHAGLKNYDSRYCRLRRGDPGQSEPPASLLQSRADPYR